MKLSPAKPDYWRVKGKQQTFKEENKTVVIGCIEGLALAGPIAAMRTSQTKREVEWDDPTVRVQADHHLLITGNPVLTQKEENPLRDG